ncbi:MAG: hypothetical protein JNK19_06760 [Tabrizicola sp.]|nr:hypothetical protein [Tabrizicola sp.]
MRNILFWAVILATGVVYLTMVLWSLPEISRQAGGLQPFDLRPRGYSIEEARAFLAALGEPGRVFYRTVQHRLDLVFPGLLALSLSLGYFRLAPRRWAVVLSLVVIAGACLDWAENAAVAGLLAASEPEDAAILAASRLTVLKSGAATIGFVALLGLLLRAGWARWGRGAANRGG